MGRIPAWAAGALLVLVGACTVTEAPEDEGDDTMNQEQARTHVVDVVKEVLSAAAPQDSDNLAELRDVPCGGLGGNERTKVKYTLESADGIRVDDDDAALDAALARIEERGWEGTHRGDGVDFSADGVTGSVWSRGGTVLVRAESDCVDNDER